MIIGIDPGNTGAIAFLYDRQDLLVYDMPLMVNGKKQQVDPYKLKEIFTHNIKAGQVAILEKVHAMPGQGVTSMFNFGMGYGVIQGVLAACDIPFILSAPQQWKKAAGLIGKGKDEARVLAQRLYPDAPLGRKKDIGRADAILIARFGI